MKNKIEKHIRLLIIFFIISLMLSGITAFALETELGWLTSLFKQKDSGLYQWIFKTYTGIKTMNQTFPFMAYGYDWLAFAHIVIAVAFIGPLINPVKNIWIIQFGCIACVMIFPLAFIAGEVRHIPIFWRLIDCSFGVVGLIPLLLCLGKIKQLEKLTDRAYQPSTI